MISHILFHLYPIHYSKSSPFKEKGNRNSEILSNTPKPVQERKIAGRSLSWIRIQKTQQNISKLMKQYVEVIIYHDQVGFI